MISSDLFSSQSTLFELLRRLDIPYEMISHPEVHTVEDALEHWGELSATHTKNLFLKDNGGRFWLVSIASDKSVDLKALMKNLGVKRLSFASEGDLSQKLGVNQGAVSPLALINDIDNHVTFILDRSLSQSERMSFHPLVNTSTMALTSADFIRLMQALEHAPRIMELPMRNLPVWHP